MSELADIFTWSLGLRLLHFLGAIVAIGGVIATDAVNLFVHARPASARVSARIAPIFSLVVWIGFLVLSSTGLLIFLEVPEVIDDGLFRAKMVLVLVVFANGVFLNLWVAPRFERLAGEWEQRTQRVQRFTMVAAISSAVSLVGWFATVIVSYVLAN